MALYLGPTQKSLKSNITKTGGTDTSDATATAEDIMNGETAYVNGKKVTGSFTLDSELTEQDNLIVQIATALEGKSASGGASVETCTVQISATSYPLVGYVATLFDGTEYQASTVYDNNGLGVVVLENVVCGSAVTVQISGIVSGYTIGGGVENIGYISNMNQGVFRAPTTAGATGTIAAYYND